MDSGVQGSRVGVGPSSSVTLDFGRMAVRVVGGGRKVVGIVVGIVVKDWEVLQFDTRKRESASLDAYMLFDKCLLLRLLGG